jgi:penicillin-binding protein 2
MLNLTRRDLLKLAPVGTLAALLAACGQPAAPDATPLAATPTPDAPSPEFVGRRFLEAWSADDYDQMYALLSPDAQALTARDAFEARYRGVLAEATVYSFDAVGVAAGRLDANNAAFEFDLLYRTRLVGDISLRPRMNMVLSENNNWRIAWTPALIIPALGDTNRLQMFPRTSSRGVIYDRNRTVLAAEGAVVTIGVIPGDIQDANAVHALIGELSGMSAGEIAEKYTGQPPEWFVPIATISFESSQSNYDRLNNTAGISLRDQAARSYPQGEAGSNLLGFVGGVSAEELTALGERGYAETDYVGKQGLESWGEEILAGKKGGRLTVLTQEGQEVETLADIPVVQSRSLSLSIDINLQRVCEEALQNRKGSIIMADVATGQILAMACFPRFDPNIMSSDLDPAARARIAADPEQPLVNRATQGAYPSGSIFKIITMAAGMELAGLPQTDAHFCNGTWTDLGFPMACWNRAGHGSIDLWHGLEQSCNVVFYETGVSLYGVSNIALQQMAQAFGIGLNTGIEIDETAGLLPTPAWKEEALDDVWVPGDTINLSIGQGYLQVTPAQMLRSVLAVASGGAVRELSLVTRAEDPTGVTPATDFTRPEPQRLPIRGSTLTAIQEAMRAVAVPPSGTASGSFGDFPIPVSGKTGTAETVPGQPSHAWFGGYAPTDAPQVAFIGMLEFGGEGSGAAAPMMKGVLQRYFNV